ncbi:hypothetical protein Y032_0015g2763 [Ancylostoma ceylanicum]|uniref:Uncharacterized protein n=1 Tax=Ancylostoma ceylanicum TaxID=53326 RepID=A0A016V9H4_9BILA|nr:hypothetical protein Y032_0015g2763 [Ancylostoma ceylanicum]
MIKGVPPCANKEEETRRVRDRTWPSHISTITDAANEVLSCCGTAFSCLRESQKTDSDVCPFFAHGTDDEVARSSIKPGDNAAVRNMLRNSITIRVGHAYTIHIQQCLRKAEYEKGYKFTLLAIQAIG